MEEAWLAGDDQAGGRQEKEGEGDGDGCSQGDGDGCYHEGDGDGCYQLAGSEPSCSTRAGRNGCS